MRRIALPLALALAATGLAYSTPAPTSPDLAVAAVVQDDSTTWTGPYYWWGERVGECVFFTVGEKYFIMPVSGIPNPPPKHLAIVTAHGVQFDAKNGCYTCSYITVN